MNWINNNKLGRDFSIVVWSNVEKVDLTHSGIEQSDHFQNYELDESITIPKYFSKEADPIPIWAEEMFKDDEDAKRIAREAEEERLRLEEEAEVERLRLEEEEADRKR